MKGKAKLNVDKFAKALGAEARGTVSAKGGHFGAMQLVAEIQSRFQVPKGGGRATDPHWSQRRLVPFAPETLTRLGALAKKLCDEQGIDITPRPGMEAVGIHRRSRSGRDLDRYAVKQPLSLFKYL